MEGREFARKRCVFRGAASDARLQARCSRCAAKEGAAKLRKESEHEVIPGSFIPQKDD
jgi:hypothetical protein